MSNKAGNIIIQKRIVDRQKMNHYFDNKLIVKVNIYWFQLLYCYDFSYVTELTIFVANIFGLLRKHN